MTTPEQRERVTNAITQCFTGVTAFLEWIDALEANRAWCAKILRKELEANGLDTHARATVVSVAEALEREPVSVKS
jgi:hypothetical protein